METFKASKQTVAFILSMSAYIAATVRNTARKMGVTLSDLDVDDLVSATQFNAFQADADITANAKGFVGTIARNATNDFLHSGHGQTVYFGQSVNVTDARQSDPTDDDSHSVGYTATGGTVDAETAMLARETLAMVRSAAESLSPAYRTLALAMVDMGDEFDAESYAATHGVKHGTVRVQVNRIRAMLADAIAE